MYARFQSEPHPAKSEIFTSTSPNKLVVNIFEPQFAMALKLERNFAPLP